MVERYSMFRVTYYLWSSVRGVYSNAHSVEKGKSCRQFSVLLVCLVFLMPKYSSPFLACTHPSHPIVATKEPSFLPAAVRGKPE